MSGHSKWAKIKRQKGANDAKRGAIFTKLAKAISISASEGGGDPSMNFTLRLTIEKAKQANMPLVNIERAIKKGTGELDDGTKLERVMYEGVMSNGVAFIIDTTTDNKNRTVSELRKVFENKGGSLGTSGSVSWQFDEIGYIEVEAKKLIKSEMFGKEDTYENIEDIDELEMELLEIEGISDIQREDGYLVVITDKSMFTNVLKSIQEKELKINTSELRFLPKEYVNVNEDTSNRVLELMSELDDHDDVENVYTNVNLD